MSKETRVLRWLERHPDVKQLIIESACQHSFETFEVSKTYRQTEYLVFFYGPQVIKAKVKFCKKCGKKVQL